MGSKENIEYNIDSIGWLTNKIVNSQKELTVCKEKIGIKTESKSFKHQMESIVKSENIVENKDPSDCLKSSRKMTIDDLQQIIDERVEKNRPKWALNEPVKLGDKDEDTMTLIDSGDVSKRKRWD